MKTKRRVALKRITIIGMVMMTKIGIKLLLFLQFFQVQIPDQEDLF